MTLQAGARLGPYEIISKLGAGGMGEVWKARDTRLDRSVAIKVIPTEFAQDEKLRLRFEREAKTISQLNHPNICTLFDVGEDYLVMELLEGESLAERIARGPIPLAEVLRFGAQVADALDRAHRAGVIHRDLKPANVMVTKSGAKLLDFGLAKISTGVVNAESATLQKSLTESGTILGTFQYMAPEQLEGEEADARTDIFALGALLYEMTTGRRAFQAKTRTSLIAAIVSSEPTPVSQIQPLTPPALEHAIRRSLMKEREDRWQSAADVAEELRWIGESGSHAAVAAPIVARRKTRERFAWSLVALFVLATIIAAWRLVSTRSSPMRTEFDVVPTGELVTDSLPIALSPEGRRLVFRARVNGMSALYLRSFDSAFAKKIDGTDRGQEPFWSPDGRSIAFFANGKLLRIPVTGGTPQTICPAAYGVGGAWSSDGTIVFCSEWGKSLMRVDANGGTPQPLTHLDAAKGETVHAWPLFVDARRFVFSVHSHPGARGSIRLGSLDSNETIEITAADALSGVSPNGDRLFFVRGGSLFAQKFDVEKRHLTGEALTVATPVSYSNEWGMAMVSVSGDVLAYVPVAGRPSTLRWYDRQGLPGAQVGTPAMWHHLALSPDGKRLAASRWDVTAGATDVWIVDLERNVETRLTSGPTAEDDPQWSPDGKVLAFANDYETGMYDLFEIATGGAGTQKVIARSGVDTHPGDWSPDGRYLITSVGTGFRDIWVFDMTTGKAQPLISTPTFAEADPVFSPDAKFFAYRSTESGRNQIYAQPFPPTGDRWQISTDGGGQPAWRGNEIFFVHDGTLNATRVTASGTTLHVGETRALFTTPRFPETNDDRFYVVTSDGQHFLFKCRVEDAAPPMVRVVTHWSAQPEK